MTWEWLDEESTFTDEQIRALMRWTRECHCDLEIKLGSPYFACPVHVRDVNKTYGELQRKTDCSDGVHLLGGDNRCVFCGRPAEEAPLIRSTKTDTQKGAHHEAELNPTQSTFDEPLN